MPEMLVTRLFGETLKAFATGKRRCLHEGGVSSSKTISILQALQVIAREAVDPLLISIVSESLPHLKRGAIRDFFNILGESQENNPCFNKTEGIYRRPDWRGWFDFFGADDASKVRGPRRDILFMNEGNNIPWETARGLDIRTSRFTLVDWNPLGEFWAHENWLNQPENEYIHSTYLDARAVLPEQVVADIESYRDRDPNWWNIYGLGRLGKVEGLVHPYFEVVDDLPKGDVFYGLDFGFSGDPVALVKNVIVGDSLYSQELIYQTGLTNDVMARNMDLLGMRKNYDEIFADSAEPKSIEEIYLKGYNIKPTEKGQGSVQFGIQKVNQLRQFWTKDSVNAIKEQRNFRYIADKDGKLTEKTTHRWSHCLVAGTFITTKRGDVPIEQVTTDDLVLTRKGWHRVLASGMTSPAELVQTIMFSNGLTITGTADHLVWVQNKGYTLLRDCRYGDIMNVCERQLSTKAINTTDTLIAPIGQIATTIVELVKEAIHQQIGISIVRYGLTLMAQFHKVWTSIIRIITALIMSFPTWNVGLNLGTVSITQPPRYLKRGGNGYGNILSLSGIWQVPGINQRKVGSGIVNLADYRGKVSNHISKSARIAEENIPLEKSQVLLSSAQTNVNQPIAETQARIIFKRFADGVKSLFQRANTDLTNVAPVYVLLVSEPQEEKQPVFDLTISDVPEFYANGILVHNCLDARRYAVASRIPRRVGKSGIAMVRW